MNEQIEFLVSIVGRLESANIPYMLTGSMAMTLYAVPRMTRDLDLVVACGPEDVLRLNQLFQPDCYVDEDSIRDAVARRTMFNVIHNERVIKADLIVRKDDPYHLAEFDRRRVMDIAGTAVYVTTPEDLILSKLAWVRESKSELHARDVRTLMDSVPELDWAYLEDWAGRLGLDHLLEEVRRR